MPSSRTLVASDEQLREVAQSATLWFSTASTTVSLVDHLRNTVCKDLTPYRDLVGVTFSYPDPHHGVWLEDGPHLMRKSWLRALDDSPIELEFYFCQIDNEVGWKDLENKRVEDPIALAKEYFEPTPELPSWIEDFKDDSVLAEWVMCHGKAYDQSSALTEEEQAMIHEILDIQLRDWLEGQDHDDLFQLTEYPPVPEGKDEALFNRVITNHPDLLLAIYTSD